MLCIDCGRMPAKEGSNYCASCLITLQSSSLRYRIPPVPASAQPAPGAPPASLSSDRGSRLLPMVAVLVVLAVIAVIVIFAWRR